MTDVTRTGNPFFDAWMDAGRRFLEPVGQSNPMPPMIGGAGMSDAVTRAQETWELCQRQTADWVKASSRFLASGAASDGGEGIAEETLRKMMDPTRFLYAGTDEINHAIQRLVEGPEFADIGTIERQLLKATGEWLALREASAAYRGVTAGAWSRAFQTFSKETAKDPGLLRQGFRAVLDRWLGIANDELIRTQRTDEFLKAQRELLAAGVAYRLEGARAGRGLVRDPFDPDPHRGRRPAPHRPRAASPSADAERAPRRHGFQTRGSGGAGRNRTGQEPQLPPRPVVGLQPASPEERRHARADIPSRSVLARGR